MRKTLIVVALLTWAALAGPVAAEGKYDTSPPIPYLVEFWKNNCQSIIQSIDAERNRFERTLEMKEFPIVLVTYGELFRNLGCGRLFERGIDQTG